MKEVGEKFFVVKRSQPVCPVFDVFAQILAIASNSLL